MNRIYIYTCHILTYYTLTFGQVDVVWDLDGARDLSEVALGAVVGVDVLLDDLAAMRLDGHDTLIHQDIKIGLVDTREVDHDVEVLLRLD